MASHLPMQYLLLYHQTKEQLLSSIPPLHSIIKNNYDSSNPLMGIKNNQTDGLLCLCVSYRGITMNETVS